MHELGLPATQRRLVGASHFRGAVSLFRGLGLRWRSAFQGLQTRLQSSVWSGSAAGVEESRTAGIAHPDASRRFTPKNGMHPRACLAMAVIEYMYTLYSAIVPMSLSNRESTDGNQPDAQTGP